MMKCCEDDDAKQMMMMLIRWEARTWVVLPERLLYHELIDALRTVKNKKLGPKG